MSNSQTLKQRWDALLLASHVPDELNAIWWQKIEKNYTNKNRKYHNLQHLMAMFKASDQVKGGIENLPLLTFSIFFHDIIYNALKKDNELKSADLAVEFLRKINFSAEDCSIAHAQIMLTKHHDGVIAEQLQDGQFMVDFDLEVLSRSWPAYQQYMADVRYEYRIYPNFLYNKGRAKVLQQFLERPFIYQTSTYREINEANARSNIQKEILLLKS